MKKRTIDELISNIEGFLNELNSHFYGVGNKVLFKELQIEKNARKYHLEGRLHTEIIRGEFNVSHRWYTRKYDTMPSREVILSYIQAAYELRASQYKINSIKSAEKHNEILARRNKRYQERKETLRLSWHENYGNIKDKLNEKRRERARIRRIEEHERKIKEAIVKFDIEFERAIPAVRNYLRMVSRDYNDVIQEIYINAKKFYYRYTAETNMSAWLIKIGLNIILNKQRKGVTEKNRITFVEDYNESIQNEIEECSAREFLERENEIQYPEDTIEKIQNAIDELSQVQKLHLELYMEGYSHKQIAEMLKINEKYSKTRLLLTRKILANKIEPILGVKIKSYTNSIDSINRTVHLKTKYQRNKTK